MRRKTRRRVLKIPPSTPLRSCVRQTLIFNCFTHELVHRCASPSSEEREALPSSVAPKVGDNAKVLFMEGENSDQRSWCVRRAPSCVEAMEARF